MAMVVLDRQQRSQIRGRCIETSWPEKIALGVLSDAFPGAALRFTLDLRAMLPF